MPIRVIGASETAPERGRPGDMFFDVVNEQCFVWGNDSWILVAARPDAQREIRHESADPQVQAVEDEAERFRRADENTRHGKMLMTSILTETMTLNLKKVFGKHATATVQWNDSDPAVLDGSEYFSVHIGGILRTQGLSGISGSTVQIRFQVVRHLMREGLRNGAPFTLDDVCWQFASALEDGGAPRLLSLLQAWEEDWRSKSGYWQAVDEARRQEALQIYREALEASGGS